MGEISSIAVTLVGQLGCVHWIVLAIGLVAILLLLQGERLLPGRPVGLAVVILSILLATVFGLSALGIPVTGEVPKGLPSFAMPTLGLLEFDELFPLAAGILLLAYVEGVSAARSFAARHGYSLDVRQEFFWAWALPISRYRSATAIPLRVDCRNPPSMTKPARKRHLRSSSARPRWRSA